MRLRWQGFKQIMSMSRKRIKQRTSNKHASAISNKHMLMMALIKSNTTKFEPTWEILWSVIQIKKLHNISHIQIRLIGSSDSFTLQQLLPAGRIYQFKIQIPSHAKTWLLTILLPFRHSNHALVRKKIPIFFTDAILGTKVRVSQRNGIPRFSVNTKTDLTISLNEFESAEV